MNIYEKILELNDNGVPGVLVSVSQKEGHGPQVSGAKMLVTQNKKYFGTIGGGELEFIARKEAEKIFDTCKNMHKKYILNENDKVVNAVKTNMVCGGAITLFYEFIGFAPKVFIFGAGHIGQALVQYLKPLGYNLTLFDSREEYQNTAGDVPVHIIDDYDKYLSENDLPDDSYVMIMTHSHQIDYAVLKKIYESQHNLKYIGLIASKRKVKLMMEKLQEDLSNTPNLGILYTPIGLSIGGTTPHEIALSIAAEVQSVKYDKNIRTIK